MDYSNLEIEKLKSWFERFAEKECKGVSPFYDFLSKKIANEKEILSLASFCRQGQPMPNLLFAAVHFLLLKNPKTELAKYYPSIYNNSLVDLPFEIFQRFCIGNSKEIKRILQTKIVQTNVINRSAYLMPIIFSLFEEGEAINIIDIGTSAGLTLNFDLYEYNYGEHGSFGKSRVKIESEIKEGNLPKFNLNILVKNKIGIDQNPIDLKKEEEALWLKALIWADRKKRFKRIENAIEVARTEDNKLIKAKTIEDFKEIILAQEKQIPLVVYQTHVLYQFTKEKRIEFWEMLDDVGKERDFFYVSAESSLVLEHDYGFTNPIVELTTYMRGTKSKKLVAQTNGHANWIKFNN